MKFTAKIAGFVTLSGTDIRELAQHWRKLAMNEVDFSLGAETVKEQRFHYGRQLAFEECAALLETVEITD